MEATKQSVDPMGDPNRGHEQRDVQVRPIAMFGVGLFVFTSVILFLMGWLFHHFAGRQARVDVPASPLADTRVQPPEPRLQVVPGQDFKEMRAAEEAVLKSYGWADREARVVRIPIDRAIELLVERGLPVRSKSPEEQ